MLLLLLLLHHRSPHRVFLLLHRMRTGSSPLPQQTLALPLPFLRPPLLPSQEGSLPPSALRFSFGPDSVYQTFPDTAHEGWPSPPQNLHNDANAPTHAFSRPPVTVQLLLLLLLLLLLHPLLHLCHLPQPKCPAE